MRKYKKPTIIVFDENAILRIESLSNCSGCGGKCHRKSNRVKELDGGIRGTHAKQSRNENSGLHGMCATLLLKETTQ